MMTFSSIAIFFLTSGLTFSSFGDNSLTAPTSFTYGSAPMYLAGNVHEEQSQKFPVNLKIPKIDVHAPIVQVGLTSDGNMDASEDPQEVAWYNFGPQPGDIGSAVLAGHSGWKDAIPTAFDNLDRLRKGDKIYTEDDKGEITTFVVRKIRSYNSNADATEVFSFNDGKAHLNLITCTGEWNEETKSSPDRLVVFADKLTTGAR